MYSRGFCRIALQYSNFIIIRHARLYPHRNVYRQLVSSSQRLQVISRSYSNDDSSILEPDTCEDHTSEDQTFEFSFRKILYSEEDLMMKTLNACCSTDEVVNVLEKNVAHFQTPHLIQTIILLWDFRRNSETQSTTSQKNIQHSSAFHTLLDRLESVQNFNSNESTCCYLYLKRLGISSDQKLMQKLLQDNIEMINKDDEIPLSVLSRFSVAVSSDKDFNTNIVCRNMMPHLLKSLKNSTTSEEIRLITICLNNLRQLVSHEILDIYKNKVNELIGMGVIGNQSTKCLLRILNFLNQPVWSQRNSSLSRELMLLVLPTVDNLSESEVKAVFKIYQSQLEPSAIAPKLLNVSEKLLQKYPTLDMLACVVQFVEPKKRGHLIELFKSFLANESIWQNPSAAFNFFTILRALKISDSTLCDDYWAKVLQSIKANPEGKEHYVFSRHSHRYMYFNNNLGGTYRHIAFEKYITKLCMNEITSGISSVVPSKFACIAPFVIGYGYTYRGNMMLPNIIVKKIESMASQFSIADCLQISRGIQIALEMRFRHFMPETWASQLAAVEKALCTCTQRHLDSSNQTDANELNAIVRALNNRKASRKSKTYQQAINKFNSVKSTELSSRLLRNMSYNLSASNFIAPQILETMFGYIVEHENYVNGDTAEKILSCSYNLGYCPQLIEGLFSSAKIIMRDFDYMTGLSIIQACLALSFYKTIPEELINKVFCVNFIKRVEEEIEVCYSKATYPERVLNQVMQLNRAVCLDFPEVDVPWFQQNYLEAQLSKYPVVKSRYSEEVRQSMLSVLKDESLFRCNHVTPYGYRIDFVIHFDNQNKIIPTPVETTVLDKITKVAILLLKLDSLCENDQGTLRGKEALRVRHLEMLGYKVVHINEADWNQLQVKDVKANYLKCLLQIKS